MIEYLAAHLWQVWTVIAVVCLILELSVGDFFIMCFAIGAACTVLAAALGANLYVQLGVFAVCSVLSLFFIRPAVLRYLHKNEDKRVSNADALIGRKGRVSQTIEEGGFGRVAIDGDDWKAVSADGSAVEKGRKVTVISMDSIILTVKAVD